MQPALRSPPAFEVSVGGGRGWQALAGTAFATTAAALVAWLFEHLLITLQWSGSPLALAGLLVAGFCLCVLAALLGWRVAGRSAGALRWDGQRWWLAEASEPRSVDVHLAMDFDRAVLLRLRPIDVERSAWRQACPRYVILVRTRNLWSWGLFRAALSTHRPGTVTSGRVS